MTLENKLNPWLLVEDDKIDQLIFKKAYDSLGIKNPIVTAGNGEEALVLLQGNLKSPFVIVCDINMPRMNGLELLAEINRNRKAHLKSIPFIIISSSVSEEEIELAYEYGVQGYFQKPMNHEDFRLIIQKIHEYWNYCKHPAFHF